MSRLLPFQAVGSLAWVFSFPVNLQCALWQVLFRPAWFPGSRRQLRSAPIQGILPLLLLGALTPQLAEGSPAPRAEDLAFFESEVRPVLIDRCYSCHSAQAKSLKGRLQLDTREGLLQGGASGQPAVVPGDPEKSRLVLAIRYTDPDLSMPPQDKLPQEQIDAVVQWIRRGAPGPRDGGTAEHLNASAGTNHWAFLPARDAPIPSVRDTAWPRGDLDRFILAQLEAKGLRPVADADRRTLIRRATFDLIGLPPTPEEVTAFVQDRSPEAFAKVVERLLASERYGERWGRHWMDVIRYADTAGDNADYPVPEARLYRNYIIDSFNADKPYDRFVQEQLAGDILARQGGPYAEQVAATGFIALSRRYATAPFELWHLTLEDTIETTGRAFMGLTLRCARCHDHKYDPITQQDYYGLYGFFASTQYPYAGSEEFTSKNFPRSGFVPLRPSAQVEESMQTYRSCIATLKARIQQLEQEDPLAKKISQLGKEIEARQSLPSSPGTSDTSQPKAANDLAALEKERTELRKQLNEKLKVSKAELARLDRPGLPAGLAGAYAVSEGTPTDAPLQMRGEPDQTGPAVNRSFPAFLARGERADIPPGASGRLELVRWLTRPDHPLTARVMVNRIWQHHFGKGIVATPSNFGVRGAAPTHPELLDYLAREFVRSGWSVKEMHRRMMLSRTYELACVENEGNAALDPDNRFYWRADRRRLEAEAIRDTLLTMGDQLDLTRPGDHPFPPITAWNWTQHSPFKAVYASNHRSVYLMVQRIQRHPFLALFDAPDANTSSDLRTDSIVPLQALFMLNNSFVQDQAKAVAARLLAAKPDPRDRVQAAISLLYSRPARTQELEQAMRYLDQFQHGLDEVGLPPDRVELEAWTSLARVLLSANEFFYLD